MIAGKQGALLPIRETQVVRRMARGRNRLQRPARPGHNFAFSKHAVGSIAFVKPRLGARAAIIDHQPRARSEEHTSELQSLIRISYAVFCLKKKTNYASIKI